MPRLLKICGNSGSVQMHYWDKNEICSDDVVFDASTDAATSLAQRRTMLLDLIKQGLLYDNNGTFSQSMRKKCLDMLGFGMWENSTDLHALQIERAKQENINIENGEKVEILPVDDHSIHIDEHTAYILSKNLKDNSNQMINKLLSHIEEHKAMINKEKGE